MTIKSAHNVLIAGLIILFGTCTSSDQPEPASTEHRVSIPEYIQNLDSLTVYPADAEPPDTVELVQEQVFESNISNDSLYIKFIGNFEVDDRGRVFIDGSFFEKIAVYLFDPEGNFIAKIARKGRGPGEFLAVSDMVVKYDQLFIYDTRQMKMTVLSLKDFQVLDELILRKTSGNDISGLAQMMPTDGYFVKSDTTIVMKYKTVLSIMENRKVRFYELDRGGIRSDYLLELRANRRYYGGQNTLTKDGYVIGPFVMPFNRSSLIGVTDQDTIYTAWTEDFLIKVYGPDGTYERAIYYPVQKTPLDLDALDEDPNVIDFVEETNPPDTWPALHHMIVDDENRIWIFSITDSDSTYQGWVLDSMGALKAKFQWPGNKKSREPHIPRDLKIKDGYLYTVENDYENGIHRIIKYKINFKKNTK